VLVSAIIVNLNARQMVLRCLESVSVALAGVQDECEIIVVDNHSTDGAPDAIRAAHPRVRLIALPDNRGFAGAANAGAGLAAGDWLLMLNNDTTIAPDAIVKLLAEADSPRIGGLGSQVRFAANGRINSAGFGVDRLGVAFERHVGKEPDRGDAAPTLVFGVSGGAALLRRTMFQQLGGFDERFFVYLEDVDLAWRARMRGWEFVSVPSSIVHHRHSATSGHGSGFKHFHVGRNRIRLLAKNMPTAELIRHGPVILAYELGYCAYTIVTDHTLMALRGRAAGVRDWREYRQRGQQRQPVALAPVQGPWRTLRRRHAAMRGTSGLTTAGTGWPADTKALVG
jgi:GT2 family glycosyltransferase